MNSETQEIEDETRLDSPLEPHRPFARDVDRQLGRVYGFGGLAVLASVGLVLGVAFWFGWLFEFGPWMIALTVGLIALWVLRGQVWKKRDELRSSVLAYCEANEIDAERLQEYYASENMYPYFVAVFEDRPTANPRELDDA